MTRKIVITGASGFVGGQLIPRLSDAGCELLLVGRDLRLLSEKYPSIANCNYEMIPENGKNYHLLVHLATLNNNKFGSQSEFTKVNVEFLKYVVELSKTAKIDNFINVSTFHIFEEKNTNYAKSKKQIFQYMVKTESKYVINIIVPLVYGINFSGKLNFLNYINPFVQKKLLFLFSALIPIVSVNKIEHFLISNSSKWKQTTMIFDDKSGNFFYTKFKRITDITFSLFVLVTLFWLMIFIWAIINLDSPGPAIFSQPRVGKNKNIFVCYKFRTMKIGTSQAGTHEIDKAVVTRVGAFLRKSKLDELPQLFNVLRGEISVVGPRPGLPIQSELTTAREALDVFSVLPGITGLSQINQIDMSDPQRLSEMDAQYIARRSLLLDIKIMFLTLLGRGQGDHVRTKPHNNQTS